MPRTSTEFATHNRVGHLTVGHQQMTEILRILMLDVKVVIMDETDSSPHRVAKRRHCST